MTRSRFSVALIGLLVAACSAGTTPAVTSVPTPTPVPAPAAASVAPASATPSASTAAITAAVSFDGKACTYEGPKDVERGSRITLTLVNTPEATKDGRGAALTIGAIADGTTMEQVAKDTETRVASDVPDYFLAPVYMPVLYPNAAAQGDSLAATLTSNLYFVGVGTPPTKDNREYLCTLIKVFDR